jgi:hypothetical protein
MEKVMIEQIRKAVLANRGGLEGISDDGLMLLWRDLPEETRAEYLASIQGEVRNEKPGKKKSVEQ